MPDWFERNARRRREAMPDGQRAADYLCDAAARLHELGYAYGRVPQDGGNYEGFVMTSLHRQSCSLCLTVFHPEQDYWWRSVPPIQREVDPWPTAHDVDAMRTILT